MEQKILEAIKREKTRKGEPRRLRRIGKIPAVGYGHTESQAITIDENEFNTKFHRISESTIIKLKIGKNDYNVLIKDYQEDILTGKILHLDFYEIERGKILKTRVPLHFEGTATGAREGGIFETFVHELEVECLPKDLPAYIVIDISNLEIGNSLHVNEVKASENVKVLNAPDQTVCAVAHKRAEEEPVVAEEEEAVEVEEEKAAEEE